VICKARTQFISGLACLFRLKFKTIRDIIKGERWMQMENNSVSYPVPHKHHWYNRKNHPEQTFPKTAPETTWIREIIFIVIACAVMFLIPFIPMGWSAGLSVVLVSLWLFGSWIKKTARDKGIMLFQQGIVTPHEFPGIQAASQAAIEYSNILQVEELADALILHCANVTSMDGFDPEKIWPSQIVAVEPIDKLFVRDALFRKLKDTNGFRILKIDEDSHRTLWDVRVIEEHEDTNEVRYEWR